MEERNGDEEEPVCSQSYLADMSYFHCKMISPLLIKYGLHENQETGESTTFFVRDDSERLDLNAYADRAFMIERELVYKCEFGVDQSGSVEYLKYTLKAIKDANGDRTNCVPLHTFGDGNCLVHAISRAITGLELLSYPLRHAMKQSFQENLDRYKKVLEGFFEDSDWDEIIRECDPGYQCHDGMGLRNVHIFALANVLRRPIILLDALSGIHNSGDYAGVFLPVLFSEDECRDQNGRLNSPLCVGWSNAAHNHFVALVGVRGFPPPVIPKSCLPGPWGVESSLLEKYIEFDQSTMCTVGKGRPFSERYIMDLIKTLDRVYLDIYRVHPRLIEEYYNIAVDETGRAIYTESQLRNFCEQNINAKELYRCLACKELHWFQFVNIPKRCPRCGSNNSLKLQRADGSVVNWLEIPKEIRPTTVRIALSDQRFADIPFKSFWNYGELCKAIQEHFGGKLTILRILHGYPPKEIPVDCITLPFKPGEKLTVIVAKSMSPESSQSSEIEYIEVAERDDNNENVCKSPVIENPKMNERKPSEKPILIPSVLPNAGNPLQLKLATTRSAAKKANLDFWSYCQQNPHLFSKEGLMYQLALSYSKLLYEELKDLIPDQIYILPFLDKMKFQYDAATDRLRPLADAKKEENANYGGNSTTKDPKNIWNRFVNGTGVLQFGHETLNDLASERQFSDDEEFLVLPSLSQSPSKRNCESVGGSPTKVKSSPSLGKSTGSRA